MYEQEQTPQPFDNLPDEIKPSLEKSQSNQNFDILLSKFLNNEQLTDIELQQLNENHKMAIDQIRERVEAKTKRPDEYQKMFFKKAFKYAVNSFFKKNKKKNRSRGMSHFYHHYFDQIAKKLNIPLVSFYHPDKKTKPGLKAGQKSFNSCFIKLILKSESFRGTCFDYQKVFVKECTRERNKKVQTFSSSISSLIEKNRNQIKKIVFFLKSSKCKVPWTNHEIEAAHHYSTQFLEASNSETQFSEGKFETAQGNYDGLPSLMEDEEIREFLGVSEQNLQKPEELLTFEEKSQFEQKHCITERDDNFGKGKNSEFEPNIADWLGQKYADEMESQSALLNFTDEG